MLELGNRNDAGVSPVVGVILLITVAILLSGFIAIYLLTNIVSPDFLVPLVVSLMFAELVLIGANLGLGWLGYVDELMGGDSLTWSVVYGGGRFVLSLTVLFVAFEPQSMLFQYVVLLALAGVSPVVGVLTERWPDLDEDEDVGDDTGAGE